MWQYGMSIKKDAKQTQLLEDNLLKMQFVDLNIMNQILYKNLEEIKKRSYVQNLQNVFGGNLMEN
jgi:hypothetical protein